MLTIIVLISFIEVFGQNSNNEIIFLNDIYSNYAENAINQISDLKDIDNVYEDKIQYTLINRFFQKSEYSAIVNDYLSAPIQNATELKKAIERIKNKKKRIESKVRSALRKKTGHGQNQFLLEMK